MADEDPNVAALARALSLCVAKEGLAKTSDIDTLRGEVEQHKTHVDTKIAAQDTKFEAMERQLASQAKLLEDLRAEISNDSKEKKKDREEEKKEKAETRQWLATAVGKGTAGKGGSPASAGSGASSWEPRRILARGWAPYGSDPKLKISKPAAKGHAATWTDHLPEDIKSQVRTEEPFAGNHQIAFRVLSNDGGHTLWRALEAFRNKAMELGWHVNGTAVKFVQETGPVRRAMAKEFFQAWDWIKAKKVPVDHYVVCEKGLRLHLPVTWATLGEVPRNSSKWEWNLASCRAINFNPNDGLRWQPATEEQGAGAGQEGRSSSSAAAAAPLATAAPTAAVDPLAATPDLRKANTDRENEMQLG